MSAIYGVLGVADTEAALLDNIGQALVFDAINQVLGYHNADVAAASAVFVKGNTEKYMGRWLAPGSGMMTEVGTDPLAPGPAVQRYGHWDTAYQLRGYEESLSGSRVGLAYMTLQELDAHLDTITDRNMSRNRQRILTALFEDTALTWTDPIHGALTIQRLANGDAVTYPELPGAAAEATDQHYNEVAYGPTEIADALATNPISTLRNEIVEHFGGRTARGEDILILHNSDATAAIMALTNYDPLGDKFVDYGEDTDLAKMLDGIPGRLHGRCEECWVSEWAWIPATYIMGVHLRYPPLLRRVDTAASGLPVGLTMVAQDRDHPLMSSYYANRYGYGVYNRLSAAVIEMSDEQGGLSYTPPAAYAE